MLNRNSLLFAYGVVAAVISGCAVDSTAKVKKSMDHPAAIVEKFKLSADTPEGVALSKSETANALTAKVALYLDSRYTITASAFYKENGQVPWAGISQFVASERSAGRRIPPGGGKPKFESWHRMAELTDVYPADDKYGAFAVTSAKETLPDGSRVVGYFMLKPAK
jgi:hypothetical protein